MQFEFATAARIIFGEGLLREAAPAAAQLGRRALVVTGASPERAASLITALQSAGMITTLFAVPEEPTVDLIRDGVKSGRTAQCDMVIAIGGGSALDAGKAFAALLANPGDPLDYL